MKKLLLFSLFLSWNALHVVAQEALQTFDSLSKNIHVDDQGVWVYVHLQTMAGMKGPRIIINQIAPDDGKSNKVIFEYLFVQNVPRSLRTWESVTVTWKVLKTNWTLWNKNKQLFVLKQNDVNLAQEEIDLIKTQW